MVRLRPILLGDPVLSFLLYAAGMRHPLQSINLAEFNLDPPAQMLVKQLLNYIEQVTAERDELKAENQCLRDENAQLKGHSSQPKMKANQSGPDPDETPPNPKHRSKPKGTSGQRPAREKRIKIDRTETIALDREQLPPDAQHRGYREVIIQNIIFKTDNVCYRLERFYSESAGQFYEAKLSAGPQGQSYGSELEALVIMFYYELRVTEGKILKMLQAQGLVISAGQISNILIKKHLALFSTERQTILEAGLQTTIYQQIDDTGARVAGVNHYFTVVCNPYYACFFTHRYKNQRTITNLLACLSASPESITAPLVIPAHAASTPPQALLETEDTGAAEAKPGPMAGTIPLVIPAQSGVSWPQSQLQKNNEPLLQPQPLATYISILICDDAPQFHNQTEYRGLCWYHEIRHFEKLTPFFDAHRKLLNECLSDIWAFYECLEAYKLAPSETLNQELSADFDDLFARTTGYDELDHRLALTHAKKRELLLVLDFPDIPLHNNESERAVREYVIKRKISNGTRTKEGTQAWEVLLSLVDTCRKNEVNFYQYVLDRISKANQMPSLASVVLAHAKKT